MHRMTVNYVMFFIASCSVTVERAPSADTAVFRSHEENFINYAKILKILSDIPCQLFLWKCSDYNVFVFHSIFLYFPNHANACASTSFFNLQVCWRRGRDVVRGIGFRPNFGLRGPQTGRWRQARSTSDALGRWRPRAGRREQRHLLGRRHSRQSNRGGDDLWPRCYRDATASHVALNPLLHYINYITLCSIYKLYNALLCFIYKLRTYTRCISSFVKLLGLHSWSRTRKSNLICSARQWRTPVPVEPTLHKLTSQIKCRFASRRHGDHRKSCFVPSAYFCETSQKKMSAR